MEKRVAVLGIVIENRESAPKVNDILHEYAEYIVGRMGIPYSQKDISILSVVVDAPMDVINALSGKLGKLPGVSSKAAYSAK